MKKIVTKNISIRAYYWLIAIIAISVVILLNIIVSFLDFRVDFTADKRYSLTSSTVEFLEDETQLNDRILFKVYLEGELPAEVKLLNTKAVALADGKIKVDFLSAKHDYASITFESKQGWNWSDFNDFNIAINNDYKSISDLSSNQKKS